MSTKARPPSKRTQPAPRRTGSVGRSRAAPSLSEQAYERIKNQILTLQLRPGHFFTEAQLSEALGLGRTPVHQAVHRLSLEGLIEIIPRKGLIVRPDSMNEVVHLLEARWALEPNIAALAAERATPQQIEQLQALIGNQETMAGRGDRTTFMDADRSFHRIISAAANNPVLADLIRPLHERSARLWHLQLIHADDLERTKREHEAIVDAIVRGDKTAAAKAMQQHIASLRRRRVGD